MINSPTQLLAPPLHVYCTLDGSRGDHVKKVKGGTPCVQYIQYANSNSAFNLLLL